MRGLGSNDRIVTATVFAGAKKEAVRKKHDDTYDFYVREPPMRNMANRRVCEMVASLYGVSVRDVHIVKGQRGPHKRFIISSSTYI